MLPNISQDIRDLLKKDIIKRGRIVVRVIKDEQGTILDGRIRQEIVEELGIKNVPTITLAGLSDQEKQEVRVMVQRNSSAPSVLRKRPTNPNQTSGTTPLLIRSALPRACNPKWSDAIHHK